MNSAYSRDYQPPFPQLPVVLRDEDAHVGPLPALIDTGADVTLIPLHWLSQLGAMGGEPALVRSQFGESQLLKHYVVDVQIADITAPGVYVVGYTASEEIILGRDVLNRLPLFLDGTQQQTHLVDEGLVRRLCASQV